MNAGRYSKAKTEFVREKIKSAQWKDRGLIDICLDFEEIVSRGGPWQWAQAMVYNARSEQYKKEWLAIFKELKPEGYKKFLEREKREARERAEERKREYERYLQKQVLEKQDWIKAGGSV